MLHLSAPAALLLCMACYVLLHRANAEHHHMRDHTAGQEAELERLGELYYEEQKYERKFVPHWRGKDDFYAGANFPCIKGVIPVGCDNEECVMDGHKFLCGLHKISGSPIIYSFGSHKQVEYEKALLKWRSDSKIFVYELDKKSLPDMKNTDSLSFHNIGLGGYGEETATNLESLETLMKRNNHTYIDVLKMDIEGFEWEWISHESHLLENVGQLLVEVHNSNMCETMPDLCVSENAKKYMKPGTGAFLEIAEKGDMRLFHNELNAWAYKCCTEMSLIQKNLWSKWDREKHRLILPKLT